MQNEIIYDALEYYGGGINTLLNGRVVKSVQRGFFEPTSNEPVTISISTVNTSKSLLFFEAAFQRGFQDHLPFWKTNGIELRSTSIYINKSSNLPTFLWQVVEFY